MMRSLFSGVSGLKSHQTRMDVIGNNIANVNTTGFKSSRVTFADTLFQTQSAASKPDDNRGGINPKQVGLGVGVASIDTLFTDASAQSTGKNTDIALTGNGLFVVKQGSEMVYTRDGAFEFDANGNYVLPGSGYYVQGWMADSEGNINASSGTLSKITIPAGKSMNPTATSKVAYTNNLNASIEGTKPTSAIITYSDGTKETVDAYSPKVMDTITVQDAGGKITSYDVPATDPASAYYTDQVLTNATIWSSKTTSVTFTKTGGKRSLTLGISKTSPYSAIDPAMLTIPANKIQTGTYRLGDDYKISKEIKKATLNTDHTVTLEFTDTSDKLVSVTVPEPTSNVYKAGDKFDVTLSITAATADADDTITCQNGKTVTLGAGETQKLGEDYNQKITGTVKSVQDHSGYYYNDKKVDSIILQADGTTATGNITKSLADQTIPGSAVTTFTIYDSEGGSFSIPLILEKTGDNTWTPTLKNGATTYTFERTGGVTGTATLDAKNIVFDTSGKYVSGSATLSVKYDAGTSGIPADSTIDVDFSNLTQYSGSSTVKGTADGNEYGTLKSIAVDSSGIIVGTYTNGKIKNEAQVAIAQFNNAAGLNRIGTSFYAESSNSGGAVYNTASALGCSITPSALEMSNVDIANEFSDMIITQRGFQSNSKIITVGDEMLETLINMKR